MTTINQIPKSPRELEQFYRDIAKMLGNIAGIAWSLVNKAGSRLNEIVTRPHSDLQDITDWTGGAADRHISVENGVDWQAHVDEVDGNPHGTDHAMLDTVEGTGTRHITLTENAEVTALDSLAAGMVAKTGDAAYAPRTITGTTGEVDVSNGSGGAGNPTIGLPEIISTPRIFGTETDNTTVEADGTMIATGDAVCYKDIDIDLSSQSSGGSVPALITVNGDAYIKARAYAGTGATVEQLGGSKELAHEMLFGEDIIPHVHWAPVSAAAGNVKWQLRYMLVNRAGIYEGGVTLTAIEAAPGVAWQGIRTNFPAISTAGILAGSRIMFTLFRDPADAADTYADLAIAPNFGVHVPVDMLGTRTIDDK
jgi:hypothetical protein